MLIGRFDLLSISFGIKRTYIFTVRMYESSHFGIRSLGPKRKAFDFGRTSFIFEIY